MTQPEPSRDLPEDLRALLPADTAAMWPIVASVLSPDAYLIGGTAIAAHLLHRVSRDLDVCFEQPTDLDAVRAALAERAPVQVTGQGRHHLDLLVSRTKVQLLVPDGHRRIEPTIEVGGLPVAGLGDLLAMKLQVVVDRPELRDYFDLLSIETMAHRYGEEGLALFVERFQPDVPEQAIGTIVRYLADLTDVPDDPSLPLPRDQIVAYWQWRVPEIVRNLQRG